MPTPRSKNCPDALQLERLLAEQLDEAQELSLQAHVGECADCQAALERVAGAPAVWSGVQQHLGELVVEGEPREPVPDSLEELGDLLDPSDDPTMLGRIGAYEVRGLIGRGTTGLVLKALEPALGRFVAIKLMAPGYMTNGSARRRFEREGRAVAAVSHEHVVPIHAVAEHRGLPYIVMKYVPGLSLEQRLENSGPLDTTAAARVGLQVAQGLAAAHAQGIVHRDVKPANVILEETVERAMVTDFGLARVLDEASMTRSGTISGTPQYMSPEQARGDAVDPRSDLFSLGSLLYAACTGRPPFRAENVYGVINRVCESEPRPVRDVNPEIDPWLALLIRRLMTKDPAGRFQSAAEVADVLTAELAHRQNPEGVPQPARDWLPPDAVEPSAPGGNRGPRRLALLGAGALSLAACGVWITGDSERAEGLRASFGLRLASLFGQDDGPESFRAQDGGPQWRQDRVQLRDQLVSTYEQELSQTFAHAAGTEVVADVADGSLVVVPGPPGQITLTMVRRVPAEDLEAAEAGLERFEYHHSAIGGRFQLEARRSADERFADDPLRGAEAATYRLEVPDGCKHHLRTTRGHVQIGDIEGDVDVATHAGTIDVGRMRGELDAETDGGHVNLEQGFDGNADVLAVRGHVRVSGASGKLRLRTSGGSVHLGPNPAYVTTQTSGGPIFVRGAIGELHAHAAGASVHLTLDESPGEFMDLSAAGGTIFAHLDEDVAARLAVQGLIDSELTFGIEHLDGRDYATHEMGDGGPRIVLTNPAGRIAIERGPLPAEASSPGGPGVQGPGDGPGVSGPSDGPSGGPSDGPSGGPSGGGTVAQIEALSAIALAKQSDTPGPGKFATVRFPELRGNIDGYTLYLPQSHGADDRPWPLMIYLQGGYGVGGAIENVNHWALPRLVRDESDLTSARNRVLLDGMIVASLHIQRADYDSHPEVVAGIIDDLVRDYRADPTRVFATGVSRGGHGAFGLAHALPGRFAAIAPVAGHAGRVEDFSKIADVSVWIAHNRNDAVIEYEGSNEAARTLERLTGETFLRAQPQDIDGTDYVDRKFVFTSAETNSHDAWSDLYGGEAFYAWLMRQQREPQAEPAFEIR